MGLEIEHKYLVKNDSFLPLCRKELTRNITQGYLSREPERTVRVRLTEFPYSTRPACAFLTIKGVTEADTREEFEYSIPTADARRLLQLCTGNIISKTRYIVPHGEFVWEVDVFHGRHQGLRIAEIELGGSRHDYPLPPFAGEEVTGNPAYYNSAL